MDTSQVLAQKIRTKQLFMVLLIWIAVVGFGMLGFNNAKRVFELDVQNVQINGEFEHVLRPQVVDRVSPFLDNGFFTLDLAPIKKQLEQLDWVYRAQVQRRWPSGIKLTITEQTPIAVWNSHALLNAEGEAFAWNYPGVAQFALPRLEGQDGQQEELVQHYQEFSRLLQSIGRRISLLRHDDLQGVTAVLDNGTELRFGQDKIIEKMQRFLRLHARLLHAQADDLLSIDFRYQRGAALRWRSSSTEVAEQSPSSHDRKLI